jgi:tetratricopeptide (TPR) repeat protein
MKRVYQAVFFALLLPVQPAAAAEISGKDLCKQNFAEYKTRLTKNPDDAAGWQELRVCSDLLKRWNEAALIAQDAVERKVQRPEPHLLLGLAHYRSKDFAKAVDEFQESIRLKDDQAIAYFQLGLAYLHMNMPSEAVKAGVRAAELAPENPSYHHQLAFSYFLTHDDEKCNDEAKRAIDLDRNDVAAYKILSSLYARQGRQGLADQMAEEAIHANGRLAADNPFVADKKLTAQDIPDPFKVITPPSDTEIFLKAQWEKMKQAALKGDPGRATSFYSTEGGIRDSYRQSFDRMGPERMREVFAKLGEINDCEISSSASSAICRCNVTASGGTMLETKVYFDKNPDHVWRIKSF